MRQTLHCKFQASSFQRWALARFMGQAQDDAQFCIVTGVSASKCHSEPPCPPASGDKGSSNVC